MEQQAHAAFFFLPEWQSSAAELYRVCNSCALNQSEIIQVNRLWGGLGAVLNAAGLVVPLGTEYIDGLVTLEWFKEKALVIQGLPVFS